VVPGGCGVAILGRLYGYDCRPLRTSPNLSLRYSHGLTGAGRAGGLPAGRKASALRPRFRLLVFRVCQPHTSLRRTLPTPWLHDGAAHEILTSLESDTLVAMLDQLGPYDNTARILELAEALRRCDIEQNAGRARFCAYRAAARVTVLADDSARGAAAVRAELAGRSRSDLPTANLRDTSGSATHPCAAVPIA
jgi:hypothetical protein